MFFASSEGFPKHNTKFQKIQKKKYDFVRPSQGKAYIHYQIKDKNKTVIRMSYKGLISQIYEVFI